MYEEENVDMTLARYEVFRSVVETGGFLKAAKELNMTQSAVSHAISSLEAEFDFTLLTRGRSGIKLTDNGKRLLKHVHAILNSNEQLLQEVAEIKGIQRGVVRIGTFPSVSINWLPKVLKYFRKTYPHIDIKLFEGDYDHITSWIIDGVVDFGFLSLPTDNAFEVLPLKKDRILCIMSNEHPLSNERKITFSQLREERLIVPKTNIDTDVRKLLKKYKITPSIHYELEEDQAIIAMVENNLGISILPELILYRMPKSVRVLELETDYYRTIGLAALSFEKMAPASNVFIKVLKGQINGLA